MACKDCYNCKLIPKWNLKNENKTFTRCSEGGWLDGQGKDKKRLLVTLEKNGNNLQEDYKNCQFKNE